MHNSLSPNRLTTPMANRSGYATSSSSRYGPSSSRHSDVPSSQTSNGVHSTTMTPQTSTQSWALSGNDPAATNGLGAMFDGTPAYIPGADDPLAQTSPIELSSPVSHGPVSAQLDHLNRELHFVAVRVRNLDPQLSSDLHSVGVRVQNLVSQLDGGQLGPAQSAVGRMDNTAHPHVPPVPSRQSRGNAKYYCRICSRGTHCSSRGTFKRHVEENHAPRYHYHCPFHCDWDGTNRKDKVQEHVQKKHQWPGTLTAAQIESYSTRKAPPPRCNICGKAVISWNAYFSCVAFHCCLDTHRSVDDSGGGGNGSGGSGNGPNTPYIQGYGSGGMWYNSLQDGNGNGFDDPSYQGSFGYQVSHRGADLGQEGSPMHISDVGEEPLGSPELHRDENAADGIESIAHSDATVPDVKSASSTSTVHLPEKGVLPPPVLMMTPASVVNDAGSLRQLRSPFAKDSSGSTSLPNTGLAKANGPASTKRQKFKKPTTQKAAFKRRCELCGFMMDDCPISRFLFDSCNTCLGMSAQQLQSMLSDQRYSGRSGSTGEGTTNGSASTLAASGIVGQPAAASNFRACPSPSVARSAHPVFGNATQSSQLGMLNTETSEPFQRNRLEVSGAESSADGPCSWVLLGASVPSCPDPKVVAQTSWATMSSSALSSPSTLELPELSPAKSFDDMDLEQSSLAEDMYRDSPNGLGISFEKSAPEFQLKAQDPEIISDRQRYQLLKGLRILTDDLGMLHMACVMLLAAAFASTVHKMPSQEKINTQERYHTQRPRLQAVAELLQLQSAVPNDRTRNSEENSAFSESNHIDVSPTDSVLRDYLYWFLPQLLEILFINLHLMRLASGTPVDLDNLAVSHAIMVVAYIVILILGWLVCPVDSISVE